MVWNLLHSYLPEIHLHRCNNNYMPQQPYYMTPHFYKANFRMDLALIKKIISFKFIQFFPIEWFKANIKYFFKNLPISQLTPPNPVGQLQLYSASGYSIHRPPFLQTLVKHGLISVSQFLPIGFRIIYELKKIVFR